MGGEVCRPDIKDKTPRRNSFGQERELPCKFAVDVVFSHARIPNATSHTIRHIISILSSNYSQYPMKSSVLKTAAKLLVLVVLAARAHTER